MKWIPHSWLLPVAVATIAAAPPNNPSALDDYPTAARADYVLGCMAVNGGTQDALQRCSCSVDVIASILPYDRYQQAETVLRMRQGVGGYLADEFRAPPTTELVRELREAQAEAEIRCF
jgi:hypothetical protein